MNRIENLQHYVSEFHKCPEPREQRELLRKISLTSHLLGGVDLRKYLGGGTQERGGLRPFDGAQGDNLVQCPHCERSFGNERGLLAHVGRKHKS